MSLRSTTGYTLAALRAARIPCFTRPNPLRVCDREKFADNLKRELPRIPFAPDFRAFAKAGEKLAKLHLDYEQLKPWELEFIEAPKVPLSYRVEDKMRLSKDKLRLTVNPSLTLAGIPPEAFQYRLGNPLGPRMGHRPVPGEHRQTQRHHFGPQPRR